MGNTLQPLPQATQQQRQEDHEEEEGQQISNDETQEEFTCEICVEPTSYSEKKFKNGDECSHPFCTDCMIKYIRVKLDDDNAGRIRCPALNCDRTLDPRACASLVGRQLFVRWCDVLCEEAIGGLNRSYCPYRNCNELIVNECGGIVRKSKCPKCRRWFCFECRRIWHAGFGCEENGEMRDRNDAAFGRLAELRNWMRCPICRHFVELRGGCQIVKCRCGISFCYKCGNQVLRHWCRCDSTYVCCEWCFRICIVFLFLVFASLMVAWFGMHRWIHKRV